MPIHVDETVPRPYYSAEMVRALPEDGNWYETVHGELLVTPAPGTWHQVLVGRLHLELGNYLREHAAYHLLLSPADISWGPNTLVQPDLFVLPLEQVRTLDSRMQNLLLVIEVLSPSSTRADRFTKRRLYQEQNVPLYWIVDGDERQVEVWTPDLRFPAIERKRLVWEAAARMEPSTIGLEELCRAI